jgi:uncharacterized membrane protein YedE/YeeE
LEATTLTENVSDVESSESMTFWNSLKEEVRKTYELLFYNRWPSWLAGILMAILALMIFLWHFPWGISGGYHNWGDWIYYLSGITDARPLSPWLHPVSVLNIGMIGGALISALFSREFRIHKTSRLEYLKGILGGMLMGVGSAFAGGCIEGGFYTAIGIFSMGGFAMMVGLGIGSYIGLRYLIWETDNMPANPAYRQPLPSQKPPFFNWSQAKPYIGGLIVLAVITAFYFYSFFDVTEIGGLCFFGMLVGMVMHRSRFCFVRVFRCPMMTGDAEMVKTVSLSLVIYAMGSAVIKWNFLQPDMMGVYHPFWIGSLVGGVFFGMGMIIAGSCASSALWRMAEGNTKIMAAVISFCIVNPLVVEAVKYSGIEHLLGKGLFVPKVLTWHVTLPLYALFFLLVSQLAVWNEKTEKFVIF